MSLAQQIMEEGIQKGLQTGLQTGLQKGLQNGLRKSLLQVLEFRFGPVPEGLNEAIQAVSDEARLALLQRAALQADSLEAFAAAL
jgi:flagellar biosynthesis/type III secretory pathway protein FliH